MNKKILLLVGIFSIFSVIVFVLLFRVPKGNLVFNAKDYYLPYTVKFPGQVMIELPCGDAECATEVETGDYIFYIEKEGYYAQEGSATVVKGETTYFDVSLEVVPGLEESSGGIDDSVFQKCYGDIVECGFDSEFFMAVDTETEYMALWEGETRRATFAKGMDESLVFVNGEAAIVYDIESGDAYLVDFKEDSRDFVFNLSGVIGIMFLDGGGYLAETENGIFRIHENGETERLYFGYDLNKVVYSEDGKIYFIGDGLIMGDLVAADGIFIGSYDGMNYYVILDELQVNPESAVMGSDEYGIYVKDGESEYEAVW